MINSEKIKERMKELDVKQKDLAEALGIRQATISQKINNYRPLFLDEAFMIAQLLKIDDREFTEYFFDKKIA